ncbi:hypothetical protein CRENBAI_012633, partial [Crenichthys baileyi]
GQKPYSATTLIPPLPPISKAFTESNERAEEGRPHNKMGMKGERATEQRGQPYWQETYALCGASSVRFPSGIHMERKLFVGTLGFYSNSDVTGSPRLLLFLFLAELEAG